MIGTVNAIVVHLDTADISHGKEAVRTSQPQLPPATCKNIPSIAVGQRVDLDYHVRIAFSNRLRSRPVYIMTD